MTEEAHVKWHEHHVSREDRERLNGHRGCVVWFTGLSGSGKSTVANEVDHLLHQFGVHSFVLDGDNIRHGLNAGPKMLVDAHGEDFAERFGLGFSQQDREENIRRIGAVAQLLCAAGIVTLTAFVSPYSKDRRAVRAMLTERGRTGDFVEVYVKAPLEVCESRDPKGLYKQARAGKISNFTGIDDPYEPPENPELTLDSSEAPPKQLAEQVIAYLRVAGVIDDAA
jgi:adenylylsulfate kinase